MRGGAPPIKSEIYLEGQPNNPCITLTTSKNIIGPNFTIKIVVNTELLDGDGRKLLEQIFTSGGGSINYESTSAPPTPPRLTFLYGLADRPERLGAIKWTEADTLDKKRKLEDADKTKIAKAINADNKCSIEIETETLKSGNLKFIVKQYSRIYPKEEGKARIFLGKECVDYDWEYAKCETEEDIYENVPLYVPILKYDNANPLEGITFINWEDTKGPDGLPMSKGVRRREPNNKYTFTIETDTDIKTFIQNLNKNKILKTDGTLVDAPAPTSPSSDTSTVDVAAAPVDVAAPPPVVVV